MKQKYKKFTILTILGIFTFFALGILIRYIIDPAGLNNKVNLGLFKDTGLAYRTQKFIELNKVNPDTIIIGGSRVHYIQTEDVAKYTKDNVYNLGLPYSTLEEQYYFLKYSLENLKIKNVLIGINLYPFSKNIDFNNSDFDKDIFESGFTLQKQLKHYLNLPLFTYFEYIYKDRDKLEDKFFIKGSISPYQESVTLRIPWEKRREMSYVGYKNKYINYLDFNITEYNENLEYFRKMVELCKKYNVNYNVFTTVIHKDQLNSLNEINKTELYYTWKREIAKITPYWDFMYINSISNNDNYFIDTSHMKHNYGDFYLSKIFENKSKIDNFGIYVTEDNVEDKIKEMKIKNNW